MPPDQPFPGYLVRKDADGRIRGAIERIDPSELPEGDVLVRVDWSSLNYKDALAATGHPGVARRFPHVPGIDAAGVVVECSGSDFQPGDEVLATSYELGAGVWGGWSRYLRAPAAWVLPLPAGLTARQAMILGTAGLTAALGVSKLQIAGVRPPAAAGGFDERAAGEETPTEIVVTGATGGVGCLAVMILAKLGYPVVAVTGKPERADWLRSLGAARVVGREEVLDASDRPLLKARWAGAFDTVGGKTLSALLRSTAEGGCVAACGLVGGHELALTVYPFILRGVTLAGIDTAWQTRTTRIELWRRLANEWRPPELDGIAQEVALAGVAEQVERILHGQIAGRVVVRVGDE